MNISKSSRIWFFNKELGYAGYNTAYNLFMNGHLTAVDLRIMLEQGYLRCNDGEGHIDLYVLTKAIKKSDRNNFLTLRDSEAYNNVINYLDAKTNKANK